MSAPSAKQANLLTKHGKPVPATAREASEAISALYREQGWQERERPKQSYGGRTYKPRDPNAPASEGQQTVLKRADWWTPGMLATEASKRIDILASNNWRKPSGVAAPDTVASDLVY